MRTIPSILVIDDNPDALQTFSHLLGALGVQHVREACSAERALEMLQTQSFSIILSDYRLGGMDGVEFLEQLRAKGDETPVVVFSGAPDTAGVIRAARQPKVDFFSKPFRITELTHAMERLMAA